MANLYEDKYIFFNYTKLCKNDGLVSGLDVLFLQLK